MEFIELAHLCAPSVHPATLQRLVSVESSFNPYAIGVVNGRLSRQPTSKFEAIATVRALEAKGYNYSLGLTQVNKKNLASHNLTVETAFDPCQNLRSGSEILADCFRSATRSMPDPQRALRDAFSCYYTGNLTSGYRLGYVAKIEAARVGGGSIRITSTPTRATSVSVRRHGRTLPAGGVVSISKTADPPKTSALLF
ncbi:lytic transglycosylase domain-containing protein [Asticcacaulis sp. EMRT-3]|uniref:lytic transglycosylase domain-containing protein n=1 Tax=Asticcacaulis sp. EMRT-3 TaxID=3040349 RepID=UPI0024AF407E|nr:lytic transglycosylase domain-containing protein [Asticcacaulis sp. EMRT-3]MDI7776579.1 lytic transglycosylase domain-containing protein [Asticcacaulis sp. EMRT-3]